MITPFCKCALTPAAHSYQFTFRPNPLWSNIYAPAAEILAYLNTVAEEYSVPRFVKLQHKVEGMEWQEDKRKWYLSQHYKSFICEALLMLTGQAR